MRHLIIDGSNLRSGGGVTHIVEILNHVDDPNFPFDKVTIFSNNKTLTKINNNIKIEKKTHFLLNKGLPFILVWKFFCLSRILKKQRTNTVLLDPAGTYSGKFQPFVSMSRNMLIFEEKESNRFQEWKMREKFHLLRRQQIDTFNKASGIIFISNYAKNVILPFLKSKDIDFKLIHHGVSKRFSNAPIEQKDLQFYSSTAPFTFIYVSPITVYKHQTKVLQAFYDLVQESPLPIEIKFIGGYYKPEYSEFLELKARLDPKDIFSKYIGDVDYQELDRYYKTADGIIFASTCENMPNVLIESMSSGKPLICSDKEPMPEFIGQDYSFSMDPNDVESIKQAIKNFLYNPSRRFEVANENFKKASNYHWKTCAEETFKYLSKFLRS
ncbi:MAG: glycosyltransferase [Sphingobacterium sp.]|jgi:glycosyltransferase involved in cell wall biosynthesis|nr:glycosyltransferase [Sphingobacterium sp.]